MATAPERQSLRTREWRIFLGMHVAGWIGLDHQGHYLEHGGGHNSRQADAHRQASPEPETDAPPGPQANPGCLLATVAWKPRDVLITTPGSVGSRRA
jgi:hypothetical protein